MACCRFSVPPSKKILRKFAGPGNSAFQVWGLRPSTGSGRKRRPRASAGCLRMLHDSPDARPTTGSAARSDDVRAATVRRPGQQLQR